MFSLASGSGASHWPRGEFATTRIWPSISWNTTRSLRYRALRISSSYIDAATDEKADALLAAFREDDDSERFIQDHHPRLQKVAERFGEFIADLEEESDYALSHRELAVY